MLEAITNSESCFVTLTYSPENVPEGSTLVPKHAQDWLKRLRKNLEPLKVRYFLVGEYGDLTQRPHYHAALFGVGPSLYENVASTWKHGFTMCGDLTLHSAQYIAGYVTKKLTKKDDPKLKGRHPEFARMSLRPGIGANAMSSVRDTLTTDHGCDLIERLGDVPQSLQHGRKSMPLGRYLRQKLRIAYGFEEKGCPPEVLQKLEKEMQELYASHATNPAYAGFTKKEFLIDQNKQKVLNMETRTKIYTKERIL